MTSVPELPVLGGGSASGSLRPRGSSRSRSRRHRARLTREVNDAGDLDGLLGWPVGRALPRVLTVEVQSENATLTAPAPQAMQFLCPTSGTGFCPPPSPSSGDPASGLARLARARPAAEVGRPSGSPSAFRPSRGQAQAGRGGGGGREPAKQAGPAKPLSTRDPRIVSERSLAIRGLGGVYGRLCSVRVPIYIHWRDTMAWMV